MNPKGTGSLLAVGLAGVAIAALVTVVVVANDAPDPPTSATPRPRPEKEADPCVDDDVPHDDDVGARAGLLQESQLPAGDWTTRSTSSCRWSLSSQDLLSIPACASGAGDAEVLEVEHTANARATWIRAGDRIRLEDRVEFYPGRQKPDAFRALLSGPGVADCFEAVVRRQAKQAPPVTVDDIEVSGYDLGVTPADLDVQYLEFVRGVEITFTIQGDGETEPVTIRVVNYGAGGVVGLLTIIGTGADARAPVLDAIDLANLVRTAAAHLLSMF
jgi:hypothetical protein